MQTDPMVEAQEHGPWGPMCSGERLGDCRREFQQERVSRPSRTNNTQERCPFSLLPSTPSGSWILVGGGWATTGHGFHVHQLSLLTGGRGHPAWESPGVFRKVWIPGPPGPTESEVLGEGARYQPISGGFHHPWQLETRCLWSLRVGTAMSIL